jgi:NADPH:quinone reductase-like Zn-dependent oxidoreductase
LSEDGTYVMVRARSGRLLGGMDRFVKALVLSRFVRQRMIPLIATRKKEDMIGLKELIEAGKVTPVIDRYYTLNEVPEAIRYLEEEHARGKVVITV